MVQFLEISSLQFSHVDGNIVRRNVFDVNNYSLNSTAAFVSAILNKLIKHMQTRGLVSKVSCVSGEVKHETLDLPA